eukprot:6677398-Pyramimonas_sp.AAC.1
MVPCGVCDVPRPLARARAGRPGPAARLSGQVGGAGRFAGWPALLLARQPRGPSVSWAPRDREDAELSPCPIDRVAARARRAGQSLRIHEKSGE